MFYREMCQTIEDIKTVEDILELERLCDRYLKLDKMIFVDEEREQRELLEGVKRDYLLVPYITKDSFIVRLYVNIKQPKTSNYLHLDFSEEMFKRLKLVVEALPNVSEDILREFCELNKRLFDVPVTIGYGGWEKERTCLIFGNLNKEDSQN